MLDETPVTILFWAAYILGTYKITEVVGRWPNGLVWVGLGFVTLTVYLAILIGAVAVILYG